MARRAWMSLGVVVLLGGVGCTARLDGDDGAGVEVASDGDMPAGEMPDSEGQAPGEGAQPDGEVASDSDPDPVPDEPVPTSSGSHCRAPDPGSMPAEDLVDGRPNYRICEASPDGCDALRAGHARRAIPRPCFIHDAFQGSTRYYSLEHDASGRLTSIEGPGDWFEGFTYDACNRLEGYGLAPAWSLSGQGESWTRTERGQLVQRSFYVQASIARMTVERDVHGWPRSARVTSQYMPDSVEVLEHHYTLDARGRIERAEGESFDADGQWFRHAWQETRRYDAAGALVEVRRDSNGKLLWLTEFSHGRQVRHVSQGGIREERWTHGPAGELLRYESEYRDGSPLAPKQQFQVEYVYGEDGRLLRAVKSQRNRADTGWNESQYDSEYRYAEDGRILFRDDHSGGTTTTYQYDYVCDSGITTEANQNP